MICPFCKEEGEKSTVTPSPHSSVTLMAFSPGYFDEGGQWLANRDPNWRTREYWCSRGHHYSVQSREGDPDEVTLVSTLSATASKR